MLDGNKKELAGQLAKIFPDTGYADFYAKLTDDKPGYLRKRALPEEVRRVHNLGDCGDVADKAEITGAHQVNRHR